MFFNRRPSGNQKQGALIAPIDTLETQTASCLLKRRRHRIVLCAVILLLPFFMFHQVLPFLTDRTFGFEYPLFSIQKQMELMFSIQTGSYPLFVPGFYGGLSSAGLSMGELLHPVSHIAAILPGYWDGGALEWNTFLRLLSLGLAHLAVFLFLLRLKQNVPTAFLISLVTVYNMSMFVLFHYGCSLETWTGFLFLVAAMGACRMNPGAWRHPLAVAGAVFWILASGHPQMIYFALLGSVFIAAILPGYLREMDVDGPWLGPEHDMRYAKRLGFGLIAGLMLSAAYWVPFYMEIVAVNAGRVDQGYAWSIVGNDTLAGTLHNFVNPFRSGSSLFGGSPLFLVAALTPLLLFTKTRPPRIIWALWASALIVFLYLQGPRTPVHYLFWKYVPLAGSFRIPGRMAILLPVLFMLLLAWLFRVREKHDATDWGPFHRDPRTLLFTAALIPTAGYPFLPRSWTSDPSALWLVNEMKIPAETERLYLFLGIAVLMILIALTRSGGARATICFIAVLFLALVQIKTLMHAGAHTVEGIRMPTFDEMLREKQERLAYRPYPGPGMGNRVIMRQLGESFIEPFLGKVYFDHPYARDADEAYRIMRTGRSAESVVVEDPSHTPAETSMNEPHHRDSASATLVYSSFNRLEFDVHASGPAILGMAYPFTGQWEARIDGKQVRAYPANGAAHAVFLPKGESRVEFRYKSPAAFAGMLLGFAAFILLFGVAAIAVLPARTGRLIALVAWAVGIAGFAFWSRSLYHGDPLGTDYVWTTPPAEAPVNRAYGAWVRTSSQWPVFPELYNGARAVDGDRMPGSGFITDLEDSPWVLVDLGRPMDIETVQIHESREGPRPIELHRPDDPEMSALFGYTWNLRPLTLSVSADGNRWASRSITSERGDSPVQWELPEIHPVRYIHVQATGLCRLSIEEIEAYARCRGDGR